MALLHRSDKKTLAEANTVSERIVDILAGSKNRQPFQKIGQFHHYSVWLYLEKLYIDSNLCGETFRRCLSNNYPPIDPGTAWELHNIRLINFTGYLQQIQKENENQLALYKEKGQKESWL